MKTHTKEHHPMARPIKVHVLPSHGIDTVQWFVRVTAANGKIVFSGETMHNKAAAEKVANKYAPPDAVVVVHDRQGTITGSYLARSRD